MTGSATYLDLVFGERNGYVAMAFGYFPFRDDNGRYRHKEWRELQFNWPGERTKLLRAVEQEVATGEPVDIYVCPALRATPARNGFGGPRGTNAAPPRALWADLDGPVALSKLAPLDAYLVDSGQPGHRHLYLFLDRTVDVATHRALNRALARYLGADTKWSDDALLRLPGTQNWKPTVPPVGVDPGTALPVRVAKAHTTVWSVEKIAALLDVDLTATTNANNTNPGSRRGFTGQTEPAPDPLPTRVQTALNHTDVADRSKAHARLVGACLDAGLTLAQTVTVCSTYRPSTEKYGDRLPDEVARFWEKARADRGSRAAAEPGTGESVNSVNGSRGGGASTTTAPASDLRVDLHVHRLPNLPGTFWEARPVHKAIRDAAHSRLVSADLVLHAVLARLAAMRSHGLVFNSGRGRSSLNHFVATVGASGTGKSTGTAVAEEMLTVPAYLAPNPLAEQVTFLDSLPIGSGEGIAEAFMGSKEVEVGTTRKGDPITRNLRCQVRHNVFVTVDEGEVFTRIGERKGSIVGATLRSAWSGASIGQANGRDDTTRVIPGGTYSLGLVLGFQPETAMPLLQDTATGMAQRFSWVSAVDPNIPDEPPEWPGALAVPALVVDPAAASPEPRTGVIEFPPAIINELTTDHLAKVRGQFVVAERDSQSPLMRCKLAALLALLAGRHEKVTEEDWELAQILWDTSCAVRDAVTASAAEEKSRQAEIVAQMRVQLAERQAAAVAGVPAKVERLAAVLAARVVEHGGMLRAAARRGCAPTSATCSTRLLSAVRSSVSSGSRTAARCCHPTWSRRREHHAVRRTHPGRVDTGVHPCFPSSVQVDGLSTLRPP